MVVRLEGAMVREWDGRNLRDVVIRARENWRVNNVIRPAYYAVHGGTGGLVYGGEGDSMYTT